MVKKGPQKNGISACPPAPPRPIPWTGWIHPITIGWSGPWQQPPCLILLSSSPPHALGDQTPFVLSHSSANLEQKLIVWILAHRPIHELHLASTLLQLLNEEYLMDIVAS